MTDGQESDREIVPLQSGQTLVHSGRDSLNLGLTRELCDLLDRLVDRCILNVQSHNGTFLPPQWYQHASQGGGVPPARDACR